MNKIRLTIIWLIIAFSSGAYASELSMEDKGTIIDDLESIIVNEYVLIENITAIQKALLNLRQSEKYQLASTHKGFAKVLAASIRKFDGHFTVLWSDATNEKVKNSNYEGWFPMLSRKNSGFSKVEILEGNVGYIDFFGFDNVDETSRRKAEAAINFVEDTDAIIFDLRKNGGGSAVMIQLISSYFFQDKTHLNSFYSRKTGELTEFWTFDDIEGRKRPQVPVYILTSDYTFSAAEEFAYNFKNLKRGTIVGEATGGGANPVHYFDLSNGYRASIPVSKAVNPISRTNWEGVGVQPDIVTDSDNAFETAYKLALEVVKPRTSNKYQLKEINEQLELLGTKTTN